MTILFRPHMMLRGKVLAFAFALASLPLAAQDAANARKLSLREAVTLAIENSRDLKLARVQYTVALNEAGLDRAAFRPNLYTGAGYVYTSGFPSIPGGGAPSVFQLSYTQSLFDPLLKGDQRAAEDRARTQKAVIDRTRDDVMVRAASVYLELAEVRHLISVTSTDQAAAEKIIEVVRQRVAANQELPIEETKAELTAARIAERLLKLQDRDEMLTEQLRDLAGIPEREAIEVGDEQPSFGTELQQAQITDLAIENDPSVKEAENERAARQHLLRAARQSYWPSVDLIGQYSVLSRVNNYLDFYKTFVRNNVNVGFEVKIPIFAAKTSATVALAKSQLNEAEIALGNRRQQVRFQSQQTTRESRELEASREVARLDLKLAQQTLELAQAKMEEGKATLRDVEQDRLDESDKWMTFLDADVAWQKSQLKILEATGQLAKVLQQ